MPYKDQNSEAAKASYKKYRQANPEIYAEASREWRKRNPEKVRELKMVHWNKHLEVNRAKLKIRKAAWIRSRKAEVIAAYGGRCVCCGEDAFEFLSIDHIHNDGSAHVKEIGGGGVHLYNWLKKEGFPKDRFQLLCMNCNFAKGKYGRCPHQTVNGLTLVEGMAC